MNDNSWLERQLGEWWDELGIGSGYDISHAQSPVTSKH